MELHSLCEIFPQADEKTLNVMADNIASVGLRRAIVTYEGKILDGRNRYLACVMAKVEPYYVEFEEKYPGEDPLQFVISANLHRRHLNESQRAMAAHDAWEMSKKGGAPDATLEKLAEQFNASSRLVDTAGRVKKSASESIQQSVRDGTVRLGKAAETIKKATGIAVTKSTSEGDKEKAFVAQEKLMRGEGVAPPMQSDPDIPPPPTTKPQGDGFRERMLSGEFDGKKWQRNIAEIQSIISSIERLPHLYHECFELNQRLEQEALLNTLVGVLIDTVKNVKSRVQRDEKTDFTEVKKIVTDIVVDNFPDIENDFGVGDNREMNEHLKGKFIGECGEAVKAAERIRSKLMGKHSPS